MEELCRKLMNELTGKGLSREDSILAIRCLETEEHFQSMLREVENMPTLNRETVLLMAVLIADPQ
jgi:hypothetical protein